MKKISKKIISQIYSEMGKKSAKARMKKYGRSYYVMMANKRWQKNGKEKINIATK